MTRGFITIATGNDLYYRLAKNLLHSYKLFCDSPLPFAIMCDRHNEYTALFDDVVILENPLNAYWDKFELLKRCPYDETIFIDADCLAYADLNDLWYYFADADDFSASGDNPLVDEPWGLFKKEDIGVYADRIQWKPDIHGGLYFIRKGPCCDAIYEDCHYIAQHYDEYRWADYCAPYADEPVFGLAMAANGCRALETDPVNFGIPWEVTEMDVDIFTGTCTYATQWHPKIDQGKLIHWSVQYCKKPLYLFEEEKLNLLVKNQLRPGKENLPLSFSDTFLYRWKVRYYWLQIKAFSLRVVRKLGRILGILPK